MTLLRLVGLAQIMECYCEVSLEGQHSNHMASQVFKLKYYISNVVTLHGTFDYYNSITILTINGTK